METSLLVRGVIVGFSIAAPVGPIGTICIQRSLIEGRAVGFLSGLGAATADAIYGSIAVFGLSTVAAFLTGHQALIRLIGGSFLIYLGAKIALARPTELVHMVRRGLAGAYLSTLFLTLTNPMTILSFAAVLAGLSLESAGRNFRSAGLLVLGVFLGSTAWWTILSGVASGLRPRITPNALRSVNRAAALIIGGFGLLVLASTLW